MCVCVCLQSVNSHTPSMINWKEVLNQNNGINNTIARPNSSMSMRSVWSMAGRQSLLSNSSISRPDTAFTAFGDDEELLGSMYSKPKPQRKRSFSGICGNEKQPFFFCVYVCMRRVCIKLILRNTKKKQ